MVFTGVHGVHGTEHVSPTSPGIDQSPPNISHGEVDEAPRVPGADDGQSTGRENAASVTDSMLPLVRAMLALLDSRWAITSGDGGRTFEDSAFMVLELLDAYSSDADKKSNWPRSSGGLLIHLKRHAVAIAAAGIEITRTAGSDARRELLKLHLVPADSGDRKVIEL